MKYFGLFTISFILIGCSKEIIHYENIGEVDTFTISEVISPPWVRLVLTSEDSNDTINVHLQKHCYNYNKIPVGLKFNVNKVRVTYEDYSVTTKLYPSYDQTQDIINKYCN